MTGGSEPIRVLVVDDSEPLRLVVRQALEAHPSFEVAGEAEDGEQAVAVAAEEHPDIVLLDLDMPGVSGLEALPRLRAAAPGAKVVVLSGLPRSRVEGPARSAGAVGYLEKGLPARRLTDELIAVVGVLETVEGALGGTRLAVGQSSDAPRVARRFVEETLRRWDCVDALDTIELLVSELVTNAVIHAQSEAEVAVVLQRDAIRVEVADESPTSPQPRSPAPHESSGRGLQFVDRLATAWGVRPQGGGKVVWFEVPRLDALNADAIIR